MKRIIFIVLVLLLALSSPSGAQERARSLPCRRYPGIRDYREWFQSTVLAVGDIFRAPRKRMDSLHGAYPRLELGMSRREVKTLLGMPDFEQLVPKATMRVPTGTCEYQWAYILRKNDENMASPADIGIYLSFSSDDRLIWALPQNLGLRAKGSPTQSQ